MWTRFGNVFRTPGEVTDQWLHEVELRLTRPVGFFGSDRELTTTEPKHLREWVNRKLAGLAGCTQRHFLHALSSVYRYAQEQGYVPVGLNPMSGIYRKPKAAKEGRKEQERRLESRGTGGGL